jgi:hypothetical protein
MEIEDTPPQQHHPPDLTSLHLPDSQDQSHKRARQHPQGSPNCASPKERETLVDYQYFVRDTMQALNEVPPNIHPTIVNGFDIPISRRACSSMAGGDYLNNDIITTVLLRQHPLVYQTPRSRSDERAGQVDGFGEP